MLSFRQILLIQNVLRHRYANKTQDLKLRLSSPDFSRRAFVIRAGGLMIRKSTGQCHRQAALRLSINVLTKIIIYV